MDTDKNQRLRNEFGIVRHCVERGGGYDVTQGKPLIQRRQVRGHESVLMGGTPSQPVYYTLEAPELTPAQFLDDGKNELSAFSVTRHQHVAYRCEQTFWVTLNVHVDDESGILYDNGYYRTVKWYEWRESE